MQTHILFIYPRVYVGIYNNNTLFLHTLISLSSKCSIGKEVLPTLLPVQPCQELPCQQDHRGWTGAQVRARAHCWGSSHSGQPAQHWAKAPPHFSAFVLSLPFILGSIWTALQPGQPTSGELTSPRAPSYYEHLQQEQTLVPSATRELLFQYNLPWSKTTDVMVGFIFRMDPWLINLHHCSALPGLQHTGQCKNTGHIYNIKQNLPLLGSL